MRPDEAFVAKALVEHLGGTEKAQCQAGGNPPDIDLTYDGDLIGVEVTRLFQPTIMPDGTLGSRETEDVFGVRLVNKLDQEIGDLVPEAFCLILSIKMPIETPKAFRRDLYAWIREIADSATLGQRIEKRIGSSLVELSVQQRLPDRKRIVGIISNNNASPDIGLNAEIVLANRISAKSASCRSLRQRLWLALLNEFWLADHDSYALAALSLKVPHPFERILLVTDQGTITDLSVRSREGQ